MRITPLAPLFVTLLAAPAWACTNIYGIPAECRMKVHGVDPDPSPDQREAPRELLDELLVGRWTFRAGRFAPDRATLVLHREGGLRIQRADQVVDLDLELKGHLPRELRFAPSGREAALWAPIVADAPRKRVALLDLSQLDPPPAPRIVFTPPAGFSPYGLEWSPSGDALFVLGTWRGEGRSAQGGVFRLERRGWRARELYRSPGPIDFLSAPPARPGLSAPYRLLIGDAGGLATLDPLEGARAPIGGLPALGLHNLEWSPSREREELLLFFRNPAAAPDGQRYCGVYRLDLTRLERGPTLEALYPRRDVHTLLYSPRGAHLSWSSNEALYLRPSQGGPARALQWLDDEGEARRIRGFSWSPDEGRLAVTVEDELWIEQLGDQPRRYRVARFPSGFCADPQWRDDGTLIVTSFDEVQLDAQSLRVPRPALRLGPPQLGPPQLGPASQPGPAPQPGPTSQPSPTPQPGPTSQPSPTPQPSPASAAPRDSAQPQARARARPAPILASFAAAPSDLALPRAAPFVGLLAASALLLALVARAAP